MKGITMDQDTLNHLIDLMDQLQIEKIPEINSRPHLSSTIDDLYQLKLGKDHKDVFNT